MALILVQLFGGARTFRIGLSETVTMSTLISQQHSDAINYKDEFSSTNRSAWIESGQVRGALSLHIIAYMIFV